MTGCSSPFTVVLVHSRRPTFRELTGTFVESIKNYKYSALHAYMRMHWHVCTLSWLYPSGFNQRNCVRLV